MPENLKPTLSAKDFFPGKLSGHVYIGNVVVLDSLLTRFKDSLTVIEARTLKPVYANRSVLQTLGYSKDEIIAFGVSWPEKIVHPEDLPLLQAYITNLKEMKANQSSRLLYRTKNPKNEWRLFESINMPLSYDSEMKLEHIIGITRDVTDSYHFYNPDKAHQEFAHHQHRCRTCRKLLGTRNLKTAVIEIKCNRCGEINPFSHPLNFTPKL